MTLFTTSQGRAVCHCHLGQTPHCQAAELPQSRIDIIRDYLKKQHPNAGEVVPPTNTYNCIGYALAKSHGVFNYPEPFFTDDYTEASFDSPAKYDVVIYHTSSGGFAHVAVVTQVSNGQINELRSKWGRMSELRHTLQDVPLWYGRPVGLQRPRPGVVPFVALSDDEKEMPELSGVLACAASGSEEKMPEYKSTQAAIEGALDRISKPDVFITLHLASTPEMARIIIGSLPEVKELIDIGQEAVPKVLELLERAADEETELAGIALYLLQRIPSEEAKQPLAKAIREGKFSGLNMYLAADALLTLLKTQVVNENPITVALREAVTLKTQE